jgi:uncharacterized protein YdaU (DUF1376 family)
MSKDPAFLFYVNDYLGDTMDFTLEQHGGYVKLMIHQFNRGHFSYDSAKNIIGVVFDQIKHVLKQDSDGLYYSRRLDEEKEKRVKYSESRSNNRKTKKKICKSYEKHMENENIDVNEVDFEVEVLGKEVQEEGGAPADDFQKLDQLKPEAFERFRKLYPGTKRGFKTEYLNFCKKHKDWTERIFDLTIAIKNQIYWRIEMESAGMFVPSWKNLQTWINQRCWEEEKPAIVKKVAEKSFGRREVSNEEILEQAQRVKLS